MRRPGPRKGLGRKLHEVAQTTETATDATTRAGRLRGCDQRGSALPGRVGMRGMTGARLRIRRLGFESLRARHLRPRRHLGQVLDLLVVDPHQGPNPLAEHRTDDAEPLDDDVGPQTKWSRPLVRQGSGPGGGVVEVEAAGGVEGLLAGADGQAGGEDRFVVAVVAGAVDGELPLVS